jgi:hypothetical protein
MATVSMAVMAAIILLGSCRLLLTIYRKEKRKRMNRLLHQFSELGTRYELTFSSQEILHDRIIGLDGMNRKILVTKRTEDRISHAELIALSDVKSCSVIKQYGTIKGGELRAKKLETYLELITLHFEQEGNQPSIEIPFYQHRKNGLHELERLEKKARHWEMLLSKMIPMPVKKIA